MVIRLSAMGDVAMTVPVLRAFTKQHPDIKITVLSRSFFKPLFDNISNVNFYSAHIKGRHKGVLGLYRLYKELKRLNVDAVADMHNVLRSKILCLFFSFSLKKIAIIDKGRVEKKALTRIKNKVFKQLKSTHERYSDVLRKLGFQVDLSDPIFPAKRDLSPEILKLVPSDHKKWIGIAPFAKHNAKMYPLDLMEIVIKKLDTTNKYRIFLFGGGKLEIDALKILESKFKNAISVAGTIDFTNEINLISNLDCMLSMDSANGHLGAIQGINVITIWGATHPFAGFAPFNQPKENMLLPDLKKFPNIPCSIYGNKNCMGYEDVMRTIPPENITAKIKEIV